MLLKTQREWVLEVCREIAGSILSAVLKKGEFVHNPSQGFQNRAEKLQKRSQDLKKRTQDIWKRAQELQKRAQEVQKRAHEVQKRTHYFKNHLGRPKVIPGHPKSTPEDPTEFPRLILGWFWNYFGPHFGPKNDLILMSLFDIIFDTENYQFLIKQLMILD